MHPKLGAWMLTWFPCIAEPDLVRIRFLFSGGRSNVNNIKPDTSKKRGCWVHVAARAYKVRYYYILYEDTVSRGAVTERTKHTTLSIQRASPTAWALIPRLPFDDDKAGRRQKL